MSWQPPAEQPAAPARRPRRLALVAGVTAVLALVWVIAFGAQLAVRVGSPFTQALTNPTLQTPLDRSMTLQPGSYTVYELTGHRSGGGGITFTQSGFSTLSRSDVTVTGPDGQLVGTAAGTGGQTLTRGNDRYTDSVTFSAPSAGTYRIVIDAPEQLDVVIAPSLTSGFSRIKGPALAVAGGSLVLIVSLLLLLVGLLRRPRPSAGTGGGTAAVAPPGPAPSRVAAGGGPAAVPVLPPPGWYPDPQPPHQPRYWDGRQWAPQGPPG